MQQQQPVQQRVIALAQAVGGRHVRWVTLAKPKASTRLHESTVRRGAISGGKIGSKTTPYWLRKIALARYSEATERERLVQSVQCS